jgi:hypothetical protein
MPGIEIGLILLAMFGARIAPVVYGATVLALAYSSACFATLRT